MKLVLVRHGETKLNKEKRIQGSRMNIKLNETGKKQIKETAHELKSFNMQFDMIAASPLSRALESANILNGVLKISEYIQIEPLFIERDFGSFENMEIPKFYELKEKMNIDEYYESDAELIARIRYAVTILESRYHDKTILLAAHSQVIKALLIIARHPKITFKTPIENGKYFIFNIDDNKIDYYE